MNDLVSVVIPTYKREPHIIQRAIDSVKKQTYDNIEIIVVDDSPSDWDGRAAVKKKFAEMNDVSVKYFQHDKNYGACRARNTGAEKAEGEFLAFLDDDDEWLPEKIEKQVQLMDQFELVYCLAVTVFDNGETEPFSNEFAQGRLYNQLLFKNIVGSTSLGIVKKDVFFEVGGFDNSILSSQDYDLWLRISQKYNIGCVNEVLVKYNAHEGERITSNPQKKLQGFMMILEKNREGYSRNKKAKAKLLSNTIIYYCQLNEKLTAVKTFVRALAYCPYLINEHAHSIYYILKKWS